MSKRYLVLGHESRDHAYVWKLAQSPQVERVYVHRGNIAIACSEKVRLVSKESYEELAQFVIDEQIDCTVVGDTTTMKHGVVDVFTARGLAILGATQASAELEFSKLFGKAFMERHGIRTPRHKICTTPSDAFQALECTRYPAVLKADFRVSSDKSAVIVQNKKEAGLAYAQIFAIQLKHDDCPPVIFEEYVSGKEVSYTILMDGKDWVALPAVRDYKRLEDGHQGPNTGGMGSYSPVPWLTPDIENKIKEKIVIPTVRGLQEEGLQYRGFLYIGIMVDDQDEPWVLEYNTRMGDSEGQTMLMLLDGDFSDVVDKAAKGSVKDLQLKCREGCVVSVVVVPRGYPGEAIETPVDLPFPEGNDIMCFGSIFRLTPSGIHSGNGRMVCVTGFASNAAACRDKVYDMVGRIDTNRLFHTRSDIALELIAAPVNVAEGELACEAS